ncbi:MAG: hypothetical protein II998_04970 [Clostridia bacterium]|nr:hypothetical protein [Clostridia bacterium]
MNFDFERFKSNLYKTAVAAKETSQSMIAITKCKLKIMEMKTDMDDKYIQIGKIIYNKDNTDESEAKINTLCLEIDQLKEDIKKIQGIIDDNLNRKECPECKAKSDKNFDFCPRCGCKFES